jgi:hypothetical protein
LAPRKVDIIIKKHKKKQTIEKQKERRKNLYLDTWGFMLLSTTFCQCFPLAVATPPFLNLLAFLISLIASLLPFFDTLTPTPLPTN